MSTNNQRDVICPSCKKPRIIAKSTYNTHIRKQPDLNLRFLCITCAASAKYNKRNITLLTDEEKQQRIKDNNAKRYLKTPEQIARRKALEHQQKEKISKQKKQEKEKNINQKAQAIKKREAALTKVDVNHASFGLHIDIEEKRQKDLISQWLKKHKPTIIESASIQEKGQTGYYMKRS